MDLLDLMDGLQVHALAAAQGISTSFKDVAVGFPAARGRCVRIFYAGEREVEHFDGNERTLNSRLIAQAVGIRAMWPTPQTATKEARRLEGEMGAWTKSFRTRVLGDSQLGAEAADLNLSLAAVSQVVSADTQYAVVELEAVMDFDEFSIAP